MYFNKQIEIETFYFIYLFIYFIPATGEEVGKITLEVNFFMFSLKIGRY